jgi:hypothetical protein
MRDMREKFGAEVKTFPYSFVIARHFPGWDSPKPEQTAAPMQTLPQQALPPSKSPKYIEIKSRK